MNRRGFRAKRIVTCDERRAGGPLGVIEDGAIVIDDGAIAFVGRASDAPTDAPLVDIGDAVITPGLVDAHTHACWVGSRHAEYGVRMAGGDYGAIQAAGGGILASSRAVAAATERDLGQALAERLARMAALGVTTVEVKSGYGLEPDHEKKQLRAIAHAAGQAELPFIVPTYLALHALPLSARENRAGYVATVADVVLPDIAKAGLARFVDVYVDENAFDLREARTVAQAAVRLGLGLRMHVGQFKDVGGAELCAELGGASADHLEHISDEGIAKLAAAGTHAVLLPVASFTLRQAPPPIAKLRKAGVPLVVASDANPGTAPTESLPLAMALAVRLYGLSPVEALLGATRLAARSLALSDRGMLCVGARADLVLWDLPHEEAIVQPWGVSRAREVIRDGVTIAGEPSR